MCGNFSLKLWLLNDFHLYEGISACLIMRLFFFSLTVLFFLALFSCHKSQTCRLLLDVLSKKSDRKFVILRCSFFSSFALSTTSISTFIFSYKFLLAFFLLFLHKIRSQKCSRRTHYYVYMRSVYVHTRQKNKIIVIA